jgi:hypothetical protein
MHGVGEYWLFSFYSRRYGYGFKAVRIRVNVIASSKEITFCPISSFF